MGNLPCYNAVVEADRYSEYHRYHEPPVDPATVEGKKWEDADRVELQQNRKREHEASDRMAISLTRPATRASNVPYVTVKIQ